MPSKTYHVVPTQKGWLLRKAGTTDKKVFPTQRAAVAAARRHVLNSEGQIVIHASSGKIRSVASYALPKIQRPPSVSHAKARKIEKAVTSLILGDVLSPVS